jgi:hypothetical protein
LVGFRRLLRDDECNRMQFRVGLILSNDDEMKRGEIRSPQSHRVCEIGSANHGHEAERDIEHELHIRSGERSVCDVDRAVQGTATSLLYSANATGNSQYAVDMVSGSDAYGTRAPQDSGAMTRIRLEKSEVSTDIKHLCFSRSSHWRLAPISSWLKPFSACLRTPDPSLISLFIE